MARTIPAVANIVLPDTRNTTPTKPVDAGSATNGGHWHDAAQVHNLNLAMVHAQPVHEQMWDGGFAFAGGAPYVDRYEITIPELTDQHLSITCRVYGHSPLTGGLVKFTSLATANTSVVTLPAAAAWTAGAAVLNMALSFPVLEYDTITIATSGSVNIQVVAMEYDEINPGGLYPGADDALAAGAANMIDGVPPLDTLEVAADSPLCSEIAQTVSVGVTAVASRVRVYHSMGVLSGTLVERPFRVVVPVYDLGAPRHTIKFRLLATGQATAEGYLIQHGPTSATVAQDNWKPQLGLEPRAPRGFTGVTVGAGAGVPFDSGAVSITLEPGDIVQAPGGYFGFAHLTIYPATGLDSFCAWGV